MKATETNLLKFLEAPKQFIIPIYQRTYSWQIKQCKQLWDDIMRVGADSEVSGHFLGSIVYIEHGLYHVASLTKLLVIDGQQRLTTLSLLLSALAKVLQEIEHQVQINPIKLKNLYLFNPPYCLEEAEEKFKLLLTQTDKKTFISLVDEKELPNYQSPRILENHQFFEDQVRKHSQSLHDLWEGIQKLLIVDISLDKDKDNPQLIFESLNSTGLDLSQADLIRNYILMDLNPQEQEEIYQNYWYRMEENFGQDGYTDKFDQFMRYYLTIKSKSGTLPNIKDIYRNFKEYIRKNNHLSIKEVVQDIYRFSFYFVAIAFEKESDPDLKNAIQDINQLKVDVAYPFLLEVYDDYQENRYLTKAEFMKIIRLIESYVVRRAICGIPTNSMNKTFAALSREIDKQDYLTSVERIFITMKAYKRFPKNDEFQKELIIKDVYLLRICYYLLLKLENSKHAKELINPQSYTIEHIMPQNEKLSKEWQEELGENWQEIQRKYLHTIGNLTLTGYNSKLGDKSFTDKINLGFKQSPLYLNQMLTELNHWNEQEIQKRAEILSCQATQIWSFPTLENLSQNDSLIDKEKPEYSDYLSGDLGDLFNQFRERVLNFDPSIREEFKKRYVAYKTITNIVDVTPLKNSLKLFINIPFSEINDPKKLCRDVSNIGHWGNGDVEIKLSSLDELEDVILLVKQAFNFYQDE